MSVDVAVSHGTAAHKEREQAERETAASGGNAAVNEQQLVSLLLAETLWMAGFVSAYIVIRHRSSPHHALAPG